MLRPLLRSHRLPDSRKATCPLPSLRSGVWRRRGTVGGPRSWLTTQAIWFGQISTEKALGVGWTVLHTRPAGVGSHPSWQSHWAQHLPLDDREVDLHLIQPTSMDRGMNQDDAGINLTQSPLRGLTPMRRAVVHDPEQAFRGTVRLCR